MQPRMSIEDEEFARDCAGDDAVDWYHAQPVDYVIRPMIATRATVSPLFVMLLAAPVLWAVIWLAVR